MVYQLELKGKKPLQVLVRFAESYYEDENGVRGVTVCILELPHKQFYPGVAVVHPNDTPNDTNGVKISFGRAVKSFADTQYYGYDGKKELRALLWSKFLEVYNGHN